MSGSRITVVRDVAELARLDHIKLHDRLGEVISEGGSTNDLRYLIAEGADVNYTFHRSMGNYSYTALHLAAQRGNIDHASVLLEKGADINAKDSCGVTPLYQSIYLQTADMMEYLLKRGAILSTPPNRCSPLLHALRSGYDAFHKVKLLLAYPHDLHEVAKDIVDEKYYSLGEYLVCKIPFNKFMQVMALFLQYHTQEELVAMLPTSLAALQEKDNDFSKHNALWIFEGTKNIKDPIERLAQCDMLLNAKHPCGHVFALVCQGTENNLINNYMRKMQRLQISTAKEVSKIQPKQKEEIVPLEKEFYDSQYALPNNAVMHAALYAKTKDLKADIAGFTMSDFVKTAPAENPLLKQLYALPPVPTHSYAPEPPVNVYSKSLINN